MTRVTTDFWVSAYLRQCRLDGLDAVLRRRGAAEAGAIFVSVDRLDGCADLYGPAPQSLVNDTSDRSFSLVLRERPVLDVETRVGRELSFDPDLWWITVDDREGRNGLRLAEAHT